MCTLVRARDAQAAREFLGPWATTAILCTAVKQRLDDRAATDIHRADSLRCANLVSRDREDVERNHPRIDFDLAERLNGVGVEQGAGVLGQPRELGDRLNCT